MLRRSERTVAATMVSPRGGVLPASPCQPSDARECYANPVAALCSGSINDFAENGFVR